MLVDTSAWVEYLRGTGSEAHHQVRAAIRDDAEMHTTDVVVMELLAGGRDDAHVEQLRRVLSRCEFIPTLGLDDYEHAAALYRRCRRGGETVRALNDCVVAAVALRTGLEVLHADRDFEVLARHVGLEVFRGAVGQ